MSRTLRFDLHSTTLQFTATRAKQRQVISFCTSKFTSIKYLKNDEQNEEEEGQLALN